METVISQEMMSSLAQHFSAIDKLIPLRPIQSEVEYNKAISNLNQLMDSGAADESCPLARVLHILGALIGEYEDRNFSPVAVKPEDMLVFLMDQHRLLQSDLPEIGSQSDVAEVLSGKRELSLRQVKALSSRFNLPMEAFA
jgi:HTH-type transcriptional regulator/antitoxin HigA